MRWRRRISSKDLASRLGTEEAAGRWLEEYEKIMEEVDRASDSTGKIRVAVQHHQKDFVESLGYDIVAVFGPGEITMDDVYGIEELDSDLIIDNWHSPQRQGFLAELIGES